MQKILALVVSLSCALSSWPSLAEPVVNETHRVETDDAGNFKLVPIEPHDNKSKGAETKYPWLMLPDQKAVEAFSMQTWADVMASQDWYAVINDQGPLALYSVPRGSDVPKDAINRLESGAALRKVGFISDVIEGSVPSTDEIRDVIEKVLTRTKTAMCSASVRPTQFGTELDVSAGLGLSGRFALNATWVTADVCDSVEPSSSPN